MSKKLSFTTLMTIVMVFNVFVFTGCSKDDEKNSTSNPNTIINNQGEQTPSVTTQDPEGTVVVNMNNGLITSVYIFSSQYLQIDEANNFIGPQYGDTSIEFVSIGTVKGLSSITNIPLNGWSRKVAVVPGCGYVAKTYNQIYARIYVVDYIYNTSKEIIGATIKYQSPWDITNNN